LGAEELLTAFDVVADPTEHGCVAFLEHIDEETLLSLIGKVYVFQHVIKVREPLLLYALDQLR
jgi:hypothetical protein